jgi:hypothetical protein
MDDYSVESLSESKNEWCARLINILTPAVTNEFNLIFKDALKVCVDNEEDDKYLMTFQVYLSGIPKWNKTMIDTSAKRAVEFTRCTYLEDLITCIHVIQLKALSCVRVCQKQKKVDINIPSIDVFLHRVYSNVARKIYMNIYLYEKDISPLQIQKNNRELEHIIKECILNTIRETMPIESILRSYMDETEEQTVIVREEVVISAPPPPIKSGGTAEEKKLATDEKTPISKNEPVNADVVSRGSEVNAEGAVKSSDDSQHLSSQIVKLNSDTVPVKKDATTNDITTSLSPKTINNKNVVGFSDTDYTRDIDGNESTLIAPKTIERLEKLSIEKKIKEDKYDDYDDEDGGSKLKIGNDIKIDFDIINELGEPIRKVNDNLLDGIEILEL